MGRVYKAEFSYGAVHLALSSGLSRERIAQDLGIGSSTLKKWIRDAQKLDTVVADTTDNTELTPQEPSAAGEEETVKKRQHNSSRTKGLRFAFIARYHGPLSRE
ncbi:MULTISPECIES: transposase [Gluconobacter]|uniref:transposase n=1 Tax=Gluconobacter TaxID=441 RepID=UPI000AF033D3|nr:MULTISPECIES: transposase [Gluconobacter]